MEEDCGRSLAREILIFGVLVLQSFTKSDLAGVVLPHSRLRAPFLGPAGNGTSRHGSDPVRLEIISLAPRRIPDRASFFFYFIDLLARSPYVNDMVRAAQE